MSLTSMMSFGLMPSEDDFTECTALGEYEDAWAQRNQAMEEKKTARRARGFGAVLNEQGLQPAFQMMERPITAQMHASAQVAQQSGKEQERIAVEGVDEKGRKTVEYLTKEEAERAKNATEGMTGEFISAAARAAAYAAASKPKYAGDELSNQASETQMDR